MFSFSFDRETNMEEEEEEIKEVRFLFSFIFHASFPLDNAVAFKLQLIEPALSMLFVFILSFSWIFILLR